MTDAQVWNDENMPPIPDGWFAVAFSNELAIGEVKRVRYFARDLVLFRTRSGEARVLDGYCSHLGANLAEGGRVMGDTIRCPFHGWQYDGATGECVQIPYCERIPKKARVRAYDVVEKNQFIMVWYHAEDKPPEWEVPEIAELTDEGWEPPRSMLLEVDAHMQEMAENNCDPQHFQFVHGSPEPPPDKIEYSEDGRFYRVASSFEPPMPNGETMKVDFIRDTWGLGLSLVRVGGAGFGLLMFSSTSPVERDKTHSRWLFTSQRLVADTAGEDWIKGLETGVSQDFRIWQNKRYLPNPVLCEADENLAEFRRWSRQFYSQGRPNEER